MPSERYIPGHPFYDRMRNLPVQPEAEALRKGVSKFKKSELIELLLELADNCPKNWRAISLKCGSTLDDKTLVAATRKAIYDATWFDERKMNTNFDYDYAAYESVAANFQRMIQLNLWQPLLELSLELMSKGSRQLEMSDEGNMLDEINDCLKPVLAAIATSGLASEKIQQWAFAMQTADRVGFVYDKKLSNLQKSIATRSASVVRQKSNKHQ